MGLFNFGKKKEADCGCAGSCESVQKTEQVDCDCASGCNTTPIEEKNYNDNGEEMAMCDCGSMCRVSDIEAQKKSENNDTWIKVLGPGCKKCVELENNVKEALSKMGKETKVEHVTDFARISSYGVMSTPALVVNDNVVSVGKVLKSNDVITILEKIED